MNFVEAVWAATGKAATIKNAMAAARIATVARLRTVGSEYMD